MSLIMKCFAVGGFLLYWEIRRPETYLKESRKARIGIELTKWLIIIGFFALAIYIEQFFLDKLTF